jgi:hypothetical protein
MSDIRRAPLDPDEPPEPPRLRALRRLVTGLTVALIIGVIAVAATLVIRLAAPPAAGLDLRRLEAEALAAPAGEVVTATGGLGGALVLATEDPEGRRRLRFYDPRSGAPLRVVEIEDAPE